MLQTKIKNHLLFFCLLEVFSFSMKSVYAQEDWTHKVRTTAYPLEISIVDSIMKNVKETYVFGLEADNDITGRYSTFLSSTKELAAIKALAEKAHDAGNHAFVYIAGLECITNNAKKLGHSIYKDHPDWVQRDIDGNPAVFGGGVAFWVREGDEDAWISPYAEQWRKRFMDIVKQIASTGIDGVYVDVPYWMTHYDGWGKSWVSFDDYTVAAFKKETGLDAKEDIKLEDYNDPGFIQWMKFRMKTIMEFFREINQTIKSVNPNCKLIPEIFPGLDESVEVVGTDVYQLYGIADAITHEYHEGSVYAADREAFDWFNFIIGIKTFRAFAENKPTWLLSYSWYNNKNIKPSEAMLSLFASEVFSGANVWDAKGYVMSSSNDFNTRKLVFKWIAENEDNLYCLNNQNNNEIGVYYSPTTHHLFPKDYVNSYRGMINLLMNNHFGFQIITPRTLKNFSGKLLILDNVKSVSKEEIESFEKLLTRGTQFFVTRNSLVYDENRALHKIDFLDKLFHVNDKSNETITENVLYFTKDPGVEYYKIMNDQLNNYFTDSLYENNQLLNDLSSFKNQLTSFITYSPKIKIQAPVQIISSITDTKEKTYINLIDVKQLCLALKAETENDIKIYYNKSIGSSIVNITPFLGDTYTINSVEHNGDYCFTLPKFNRGAIIWINKE